MFQFALDYWNKKMSNPIVHQMLVISDTDNSSSTMDMGKRQTVLS
jgi:hypothetical protein